MWPAEARPATCEMLMRFVSPDLVVSAAVICCCAVESRAIRGHLLTCVSVPVGYDVVWVCVACVLVMLVVSCCASWQARFSWCGERLVDAPAITNGGQLMVSPSLLASVNVNMRQQPGVQLCLVSCSWFCHV